MKTGYTCRFNISIENLGAQVRWSAQICDLKRP